jgi:hypothetical protein
MCDWPVYSVYAICGYIYLNMYVIDHCIVYMQHADVCVV